VLDRAALINIFMKFIDILSEGKKPTPPKTRSPAAASLADRKYQQKIIPNKKKKIDPKHKKAVAIDEAGGAQRAAIAIAKKKSGKYDKDGKRIREGVGRRIGTAVGTVAGSEFGPAGRTVGGAIGGFMGHHAEKRARSAFNGLDSFLHKLDQELAERADDNGNSHCWTGYRKVGLKKKGGKMVNDCRPIKGKK
jgi:hypothetical protein